MGFRWRLVDDPGADDQPALFDETVERRPGTGQFAGMEFLHVRARRIVNEIPAAAQLPFRFTINAYRGCSHACVYCFARPSHDYLGLGIGEDFERRIVVKVNAVERLRRELADLRWRGEPIAMGTNTDPYQRCEGQYRLTQGIVETLGVAANPFSILTKSTLILRDLERLVDAADRTSVSVNLSIGTLDDDVWRSTEPGTPHPQRRLEAVARLNEAGIDCGVFIAPVLPGLSDHPDQLEALVAAAAEAGATNVGAIYLHLRPGVRGHYLDWLAATRPDLVERHHELYGSGRSYAPATARGTVQEIVAAARARHRWRRSRPPRAAAVRARPAATAPGIEQLNLDLL